MSPNSPYEISRKFPQVGFKPELQVKVYLNLMHALTHLATTFIQILIISWFGPFKSKPYKSERSKMQNKLDNFLPC